METISAALENNGNKQHKTKQSEAPRKMLFTAA